MRIVRELNLLYDDIQLNINILDKLIEDNNAHDLWTS